MTHRVPLTLTSKNIPGNLQSSDTMRLVPRAGLLAAIGSASAYPKDLYVSSDTQETYWSNGTSWVKIGAAPGGPTTSVQYNNGGSFAGSSQMVFNVMTGLSVNLSGASGNEMLGSGAGNTAMTGENNTLVGKGAGTALTDGDKSVLIGGEAGATLLSSFRNVIIGYQAASLAEAVSGTDFFESVAVGYRAYRNGLSGNFQGHDVAIGANSLPNSGGYNVAIGDNAGMDVTDGSGNVMVGRDSTTNLSTGGCVLVGNNTGSSYDNCIALGYSATTSAQRQVVIGSASVYYTDFYFGSGIYAATDTNPEVNLRASPSQGFNVAGSDLNIYAGESVGNGVAGKLSFFTSPVGSSGAGPNLGVKRVQVDDGGVVAGNTGLMLWDVDNNTLERVTVGAADSGGTGFKVLRIPN